MAKQENVSLTGTIVDTLPGAKFLVESDYTEALCTISGKMRINNIKLLLGDEVEFEVSPYDFKKGRITKRL